LKKKKNLEKAMDLFDKGSEALYGYIRNTLKEDFGKFHPIKAAVFVSAKLGKPVPPDAIELIRLHWVREVSKLLKNFQADGKNLENPRIWKKCLNSINS